MVEINNQRKAFLDMLAVEELITDVRNQKSWLWRHCRRRAIYWITPITLAKLVTLNPKLKSPRRRTLPASFPLVGCLPQAAYLKDSLRKVRRCGIRSRLRSVALYLWLIVVISVRQSTAAVISGLLTAGRWLWSVRSIRLTAWLQNSKKRAERSERLMMSRVIMIISARLSASSSACHGLLITKCDNAITYKAQRDKMPENWSWRTRQLLTCRCVSVMLLRSMQNTRRS